jgi:hypothetical protein
VGAADCAGNVTLVVSSGSSAAHNIADLGDLTIRVPPSSESLAARRSHARACEERPGICCRLVWRCRELVRDFACCIEELHGGRAERVDTDENARLARRIVEPDRGRLLGPLPDQNP